ncbi:MAG: 50S ribosomal protein L5 [Candidatus Gracilibacteria bacterium]|jgi:large subunit ribosomal protein L5
MSTLQEKYIKEVVPMLQKELGRKNINSLPKLRQVSISVGIGSMVTGGMKDFSHIETSIAEITGQKPVLRKARKAISNFKLRAGLPVGLNSTLRGDRAYDFISRLVNIALPRVRDFRGISSRGMDGQGNFSLGLEDCTIFPEVNQEKLQRPHGLQVNVSTTAKNNRETYLLLKALGFPFRDEPKDVKPSKK